MPSSYKIIKSHANEQQKRACVIPVHDIKREAHPSVLDPVEKSRVEAERIMREAEYAATQIRDGAVQKAQIEAQASIDELKKNTYDEAYKLGFKEGNEEGLSQGIKEGQEQGETIRRQAKFVLQNAHKRAQDIMDRNEAEIIELAVHIAKRILLKSISENEEHLLEIAKDACVELKNKTQIIIHINPNNSSLFLSHIDIFQQVCPDTIISVLEDERVNETGCILETETKVIDTQITNQLEEVKEALLEMRMKDEE